MTNMHRFSTTLLISIVLLLPVQASSPANNAAEPNSAATAAANKAEPAPAEAPKAVSPFILDHYKVYNIVPSGRGFEVWLRGQFDGYVWDYTRVHRYSKFLNPADKNNEGMNNKHAHLNWYDIQQEELEPIRSITVSNQFGIQRFRIDQPVALLVPAEKEEAGSQFPDNLDHYKVYKILVNAEVFTANVTIKDQFGTEENTAYQAAYFAVPVEKRHDEAYYQIINPDDHLVFYQLDPKLWDESRATKDQFGVSQMKTRYSELLGVPSRKLGWTE